MTTVAKLLRFLKATAAKTHHSGLSIVEGGALRVQAGRAYGVLDHVELFQL